MKPLCSPLHHKVKPLCSPLCLSSPQFSPMALRSFLLLPALVKGGRNKNIWPIYESSHLTRGSQNPAQGKPPPEPFPEKAAAASCGPPGSSLEGAVAISELLKSCPQGPTLPVLTSAVPSEAVLTSAASPEVLLQGPGPVDAALPAFQVPSLEWTTLPVSRCSGPKGGCSARIPGPHHLYLVPQQPCCLSLPQ